MSSGVLHRSLHSPTAVNAACCIETRDGHIVLLLQDTHLTCWKVGSDGLQQTASWRAPASMLQLVYLPSSHLLLLAEGGHCCLHQWQDECADLGAAAPPCVSHAQLQAPVGSSCSQVQPYGCVISSNVLSAQQETAQQETPSLAAVAYMPGVLHVIKASPSTPQAEISGATASRTAAAAVGSHMQLQIKAMALSHALLSCHYPGGDPPALASVRVHTRVLALTWLNPAEQQLDLEGRSLLAVLHEYAVGGNPPVLHADCVAVNWLEGSISPGPWSIRNVHPTTRLLQPFPASAQLPPGVLMISSRGVQLCTCLGSNLQQHQHQHQQQAGWQQQEQATSSSAAMQAAAAAGDPSAAVGGLCVVQHQLAQWALSGLPCSCVALNPGQWLVGDARAGLTVLQLPESSSAAASWLKAQSRGCLSIPHVLLHVPFKQQQQQQQEGDMMVDQEQHLAGLLVLGSKCSSSQVVGLPHVVAACGQAGDSQQQQLVLPVLQSALLPSLAGAQAAAVYTDPSGALPEQQLLVACGMAPRGKLSVVRSGCGLLPVMLDGPELPGDAALFAIKQPQQCQHKQSGPASQPCQQEQQQQQPGWCADQHSMLGFSFPSVGASSVMSLEGNTFRQLQLEGLSQQEASLLMATAPGGWMVQVTAGGVRVLDPTANWQLHSQWVPAGGTISLAAACGSHLVVACGSSLTCFSISCCQGTLEVTATTDLQQQASALGMFTLQGGQPVVAVGLWVDNSIILFSLAVHTAAGGCHTQPPQQQQQQQQGVQGLDVLCCVALDADQPRSVALLPVGGADILLVGSNTGKVLMWQVTTSPHTSHQQQQQQASLGSVRQAVVLQHARSVQISNVSVSLQSTWLPADDEDPSPSFSSTSSSSSTVNAAETSGSRPAAAVPCVVAHAGAMAFFKPNQALLAAAQLQSGANMPDAGKAQQAAAAAAQPAHAAAATHHHAFAGLGATAFVAVSRLCGSEGCLGAAPVHTPHMPFSLAWVSASHRLCFGSLSGQHRLRWRSCGLPGTPLALAVHETSDTLVLLLAADEFAEASSQQQQQQDYAQQRLVVLDARSLQVLMVLALAPGHTYTSLQVLELPATSQQQQQQQHPSWGHGSSGGGAAVHAAAGQKQQQQERQQVGGRSNSPDGCLPFIVLGSHVVLAAPDSNSPASSSAAGGGAQPRIKRVGMLSFFELKKSIEPHQQQQQQGAGSSGGSAALRYELVLHGMVPLSVTPSSACTVVPELLSAHHHQQQQQQPLPGGAGVSQTAWPTSPASTAAAGASPGAAAAPAGGAELPLLVVGSEKGVTLLRVVVDDARLAEQQHLEQLLADVAQVPPDSLGLPAPAQQQQQQQQQAVCKDAPNVVHGASQAVRRSHVSVQELSTVSVCFRGVVTKLSSSGSSIFALESLGPVTVLRALAAQPGGWVQPVPVAVDARSRLMAVDFCVDPASTASLPAAAAAYLAAEAGGAASPAAGSGALQQGRTGGAGTSSEVRRAGSAAGQQQPPDLQQQQQQHQAILVATHPAGLMLLQRDLQQEASDLSAMLEAAQTAWERGQRPHGHMTAGRSVLLTEMTAAALGQPWQGAGEAAPWAAGHPLQHIQQQMMAEVEAAGAGAAEIAAAAREVLVAYARLSGSAVGQEGLVHPDWLSLLSVSPGLAAPMLPSAECAPAPGSMLLCQAQLGLHPAPVAGRTHTELESSSSGGGGGRGGGPDDEQDLISQGFLPGSCIVCLSASGGVSAAQLLPPAQAAALLAWQKAASFDVQGLSATSQLLNWGQGRTAAAPTTALADTTSSSSMAAAAVAEMLLRGLPCPDAAASYENYDQAPGALPAGTDRLQRAVQGAQEEQHGQREEVEPVGAVEGDLLFMGVAPGAADAAGGHPAVILQHRLWQHAL